MIQRLLQAVMNLSQLAESDARQEEAQHRERHHAVLIAAIVCRIWQDTSSVPQVCIVMGVKSFGYTSVDDNKRGFIGKVKGRRR